MAKNIKLTIKDLTISFKTTQGLVRAVRGVDLELYEGETLAIVGESGSGKSVTSRAVMGILAGNAIIDKGEIHYEGQDLTQIEEEDFHKIRGNKIGMIFQDPMSSLNPIMRIGKQITEGIIINGKRLKNMYNDLMHAEKMRYLTLKRRKKTLVTKFKEESAVLKTQGNQAEIANLKSVLKQNLAERKKELSEAKVSYILKKQQAKQEVNQYWTEQKNAFQPKIQQAQKNLKAATDQDEKKKLRHQLNGVKEELRRIVKVTHSEAKERALEVMREVGIDNPEKRFTQYPFQFSGGMRQRIVVAIALTANPDLLICDEPTTALDVTIQAQILDLIKDLKKNHNLSVIFITHDLGVVANMADRVAVMYAGKIVEIGSVDEIFYEPKHPYTWALLGSMPDLNSKERLTAIPGTPPNMLFPPKGDSFAERSSYAMQIDFEQEPPYFKISETHYAATWLLHPDAPKVEMPKIVSERIRIMKEHTSEVKA